MEFSSNLYQLFSYLLKIFLKHFSSFSVSQSMNLQVRLLLLLRYRSLRKTVASVMQIAHLTISDTWGVNNSKTQDICIYCSNLKGLVLLWLSSSNDQDGNESYILTASLCRSSCAICFTGTLHTPLASYVPGYSGSRSHFNIGNLIWGEKFLLNGVHFSCRVVNKGKNIDV